MIFLHLSFYPSALAPRRASHFTRGAHAAGRGADRRRVAMSTTARSPGRVATLRASRAGISGLSRGAIARGAPPRSPRGAAPPRPRSRASLAAIARDSRPPPPRFRASRVAVAVPASRRVDARRPTRPGAASGEKGAGSADDDATDPGPSADDGSGSRADDDSIGGGDDGGGGEGSGGGDSGGGGGGGGGDDNDSDSSSSDPEGSRPDTFRTLDEAESLCRASVGRGLPEDMASIASAEGIRASVLADYCALAKLPVIGALFSWFPAIRDRALADPLFLFKLGVEVLGDAAFSLAAESPGLGGRRGERFTDEAEFFLADVLASAALNASVLTMLSPAVVIGRSPGGGRALRTAARVDGKLNDFLRLLFCRALPPKIPASAFVPGAQFTIQNRVLAVALQGVRVGGVAALAGFAGQLGANATCALRRKHLPGSYSDAYAATVAPEAPPLLEPAFEWGVAAGAGGNLRQQAIIGAELWLARALSLDGGAKTAGVMLASAVARLGNNVLGGEQFARRMRAMEDEVYGKDGE